MATLQELYNLRYESSNLKNRVVAAMAATAITIIQEDAGTAHHTERVVWAKGALQDTRGEADRLMWGVLAVSSVVSAGEAVTDTVLQSAVDLIVGKYAV